MPLSQSLLMLIKADLGLRLGVIKSPNSRYVFNTQRHGICWRFSCLGSLAASFPLWLMLRLQLACCFIHQVVELELEFELETILFIEYQISRSLRHFIFHLSQYIHKKHDQRPFNVIVYHSRRVKTILWYLTEWSHKVLTKLCYTSFIFSLIDNDHYETTIWHLHLW